MAVSSFPSSPLQLHQQRVTPWVVYQQTAMSSKRPWLDPDDACTSSNCSVKSWFLPAPATMSSRPSLAVILSSSPIWTMERTTCISIKLNPGNAVHRNVIWRNCICFWEDKLKLISPNTTTKRDRSACFVIARLIVATERQRRRSKCVKNWRGYLLRPWLILWAMECLW